MGKCEYGYDQMQDAAWGAAFDERPRRPKILGPSLKFDIEIGAKNLRRAKASSDRCSTEQHVGIDTGKIVDETAFRERF